MPDCRYGISSKPAKKKCEYVILEVGGKVYYIKANGKDKEVKGASHTAADPCAPAPGDRLNLGELANKCALKNLDGVYRHASGNDPEGFHCDTKFTKSEPHKAVLDPADWEAVDDGGLTRTD